MPLNLTDVSACVLAFSLLMYVMLDGTDLGVGMLFAWFTAEEDRRRLADSILPVWDANETWLVLLAGGLLALFPAAYSQLFTAVYVPLFVMLFALIARAVALEYRSHASSRVKKLLDRTFIIASALASFSQGCLAGVVMQGIPSEDAFAWLSFYPVICGVGVMVGYLLLGCGWVRWRLRGDVGERASLLATLFGVMVLVALVGVTLLLPNWFLQAWQTGWAKTLVLLSALLWCGLMFSLHGKQAMLPLLFTLLLSFFWLMLLLLSLYPWLLPGTLTLQQAASSPATQKFMLGGIAVVIPVTLIYNSWSFWVFRGKVS